MSEPAESDRRPSENGGPARPRRRRRQAMIALLFSVAHLLGVVSSVDAVFSTRTSQGAIAWIVSLNTFPIVSVPAYWVLGRSKFVGYVTARRDSDARDPELVERVEASLEPFLVEDPRRPRAARAAEALASLPVLRGNAVELLIDGEATFDSIVAGLERAQRYALVQFYIVHDDGLGRRLRDALVAAAERGVQVRFLFDEIGSHALPAHYLDGLRAAGVEATAFHSRKGPRNRFQLNFRNHRKVVVVDGREAWIGGHNVGDEYLGLDPEFGAWRDTHVRIEGPAALGAQLAFAEDWRWATGAMPELDWTPVAASDGSDARVLVMPTGPADELETASLMFVHAIQSARDRIWIASPYFVPDDAVMAALQLARLRGVDVRLLIPDRPDHLLVYLAAYTYFDQVDVPFFRYTDGFLHQKVLLVDDDVAAVGTANFDNRSFRLNFEITALVSDPGFVEQVEAMFEADFARSRRMEPGEFAAKPWWFRFGARAARLMSPIL